MSPGKYCRANSVGRIVPPKRALQSVCGPRRTRFVAAPWNTSTESNDGTQLLGRELFNPWAPMPERFAQQALGHSSKAFVRAYSRKARVVVPSLEDYEAKIVPLPIAVNQ
jgi:hypothetical protein